MAFLAVPQVMQLPVSFLLRHCLLQGVQPPGCLGEVLQLQ
jgi:hypothetical protein